MSEVRMFVRALAERLAREQAGELSKIASNQFKSGKQAKYIAGNVRGLARAAQIASEIVAQYEQGRDGADLPEMPGVSRG